MPPYVRRCDAETPGDFERVRAVLAQQRRVNFGTATVPDGRRPRRGAAPTDGGRVLLQLEPDEIGSRGQFSRS